MNVLDPDDCTLGSIITVFPLWLEAMLTSFCTISLDDFSMPCSEGGGSNYDSLIVRTVAFPFLVAYWTKRSWPPAELVSHVNFDQLSGDMAVGSRGLVAILA